MMTVSNIATNRNPGIVPPWLSGSRNPGIVPPYLQQPVKILPIEDEYQILPVEDEPIFTILPFDGETQFVSEPVDVSPTLAEVLRGR